LQPSQGFTTKVTDILRRNVEKDRAGEGIRTLDIQLGKLSLCQLSYTRDLVIAAKTLRLSISYSTLVIDDFHPYLPGVPHAAIGGAAVLPLRLLSRLPR
jgi:hypothetical protein